jgi:2-desacetyl-2-hydroxyethyl bacteriochlorophyllide A dehydrogenase
MKSIYFDQNIPKFIVTRLLGKVWKGAYYSPLSPVSLREIEEVPLPGPNWVRIKNQLSGICASDLSLFFLKMSPSVSLAALPGSPRMFLGHEIYGEVIETGKGCGQVRLGNRVVQEKFSVCCSAKEIEPKCRHCEEGNYSICENQAEGFTPENCGGGWSQTMVAHESQLVVVPNEISDEEAVLIEPAAVALHAVLLRPVEEGEKVLVIGAGIIGLLTLQILKQIHPHCRAGIIARHPFQQDLARAFGADHIITEKELYPKMAAITGAKLYTGMSKNQMLIGGFDKVFDCMGTASSIQDSLRWTRARGTVILVGMDLNPTQYDYSPILLQEMELVGSFIHGMESYEGEKISSFNLVIELLKTKKLKLEGLVTHRFKLEDYCKALETTTHKKESKVVKAVFDLNL